MGRQKQGQAQELEDTSLPQARGVIFSFLALHSATSLTTAINRVCRSAHQAELPSFVEVMSKDTGQQWGQTL